VCGVSGVLDMNQGNRIERHVIYNMASAIQHRGPDDTGYYIDKNLALSFNRLSIIDLSGGHQPLTNEDGSIVLVCNGEIFNYLELREQLKIKGHIFKTSTDIEVIIHLYEEYGVDFLNMLNGQFAFFLFDKKKNFALCARDHVGIAPFFYTVVDGLFIFASEIKAILEHPAVRREVDLVGLDQTLTFPSLVSPQTMFRNIRSLPSGNFLTIKNMDEIKVHEYWDLIYPQSDYSYIKTEDDYLEMVSHLLSESVKLRLQSDVPVGFYISGGLDSSIIGALAASIANQSTLHSFSVDFTNNTYSEGRFQKLMSSHINTRHINRLCSINDVNRNLEKAVFHSECILKETYDTASLMLSEAASENGIKVILTGEGADELFAGYMSYKFDKMRNLDKRGEIESQESYYRKKLWGDENLFYERDYYSYEQIRRDLYSDELKNHFEDFNCLNYPTINKERVSNIDPLHKRSYIDFKIRLADHLLSDHGDRVAFAHGVEARYPFLDKDLIECVRFIPPHLKLNGLDGKYILKRLAEPLVPKEIIKRPKTPFAAPGSPEILKLNTEYINDILSYDTIKRQGFFNPDMIESLKKKYVSDKFQLNVPYDDDFLICVITFGILLEKFNLK